MSRVRSYKRSHPIRKTYILVHLSNIPRQVKDAGQRPQRTSQLNHVTADSVATGLIRPVTVGKNPRTVIILTVSCNDLTRFRHPILRLIQQLGLGLSFSRFYPRLDMTKDRICLLFRAE